MHLSQAPQLEQAVRVYPRILDKRGKKNNTEKEGGKAGTPLHLLSCSIQHTDFIQQLCPALYAMTALSRDSSREQWGIIQK